MDATKIYKILLVDDDITIITLLQDILTNSGFQIITASNGIEALETIRKEPPDLILMDWNMPVMDGLNTLIEINTDETMRDIPVIMLTGVMTNPTNLKLAFDNGAFDYLKKNFDIVELKARIGAALKFAKTHQQILDIKNNELTENNLKISRHNQFRKLCIDKIDELITNIADSEKSMSILKEFKSLVQSSDVINNWNQFNEHFISIHPDFYRKLSIRHPELGPAELKICALLKLNLSTKEIADITYRTPKTVKTMRSRIRKKLGLNSDAGLATYLIQV
jgi:DNA-binding response OmpR family regulator/DNA-binding CsgD family transcriptional regulator